MGSTESSWPNLFFCGDVLVEFPDCLRIGFFEECAASRSLVAGFIRMKRSDFGLDGETALSILDGNDVHREFLPHALAAFFAVNAPETQTLPFAAA